MKYEEGGVSSRRRVAAWVERGRGREVLPPSSLLSSAAEVAGRRERQEAAKEGVREHAGEVR